MNQYFHATKIRLTSRPDDDDENHPDFRDLLFLTVFSTHKLTIRAVHAIKFRRKGFLVPLLG